MKVPRKCQNHQVQSSRGTNRRYRENIMTKQTSLGDVHIKNYNRRTEPPWNGPEKGAYTSFIRANCITKTRLPVYNFDQFKPHFYIVKLGFTGYTLFFLFLLKKHWLRVLVRTASTLTSTRSLSFEQKFEKKKYQNFLSENLQFLVVKCQYIWNRHVFVMV